MRIALTAVAARKSGGSTFILEKLIDSFPRVADEHRFRIFVSDHFAKSLLGARSIDPDRQSSDPFPVAKNVELVIVASGSQWTRLRWDQVEYLAALKRFGAEVSVNALGFGPLFPGIPQCTVLQDSTYFCAWRGFQRTLEQRIRTELLRRLLIEVMKRSERIIVPSQALADSIAGSKPKLAKKLSVLRDPFEADYSDPVKKVQSRESKTGNEPFTILYVSHLEPHKAHSLLPDVALELRKRSSVKAKFVAAIDRKDAPRLYDAFRLKVEETGTSDDFEILPRLPHTEVTKLFSRADVFFFPSLCESFGYPMAEAGAAGLPVVAADTAINREMLGEHALYFPPGRADKAAEALERLAVDPRSRISCALDIQRHQRSLLPDAETYARRLVNLVAETAYGKH